MCTRLMPKLGKIIFSICVLSGATAAFAAPTTFNIPVQAQFGGVVSGRLTFDPSGIYFAGPFAIAIGPLPNSGLPGDEFTNLNTVYVVQPNTSFHGLWVFNPSTPFDHLFLFIGFDSCLPTGTSCIFEMTYYLSGCSDCPPSARVQGAITGYPVVPYGLLGPQPPYAPPGQRSFAIPRTVPLIWQYTDATGAVVNSSAADPTVRIAAASCLGSGGTTIPVDDPGSSGLQYDDESNTWQFNWKTTDLSAGCYDISIASGQTGQIDGPFPIQLR